ncbi:GHKL domain-containing protein [Bacillus sp. YZJH907-2]|uniref:histidine kinase n=2 Tax=Halalkalibacter suaedae TaxID=2822140 RepID=A0A940WZZ1_9BACI|nr:GHKL domain-containing protein [Bacillus suaedae]
MEVANQNSKSSLSTLIKHLEEHETTLLTEWENQIIVDPEDPSKEKVRQNGYLMYQLTKKTLFNEITESEIEELANKIALERIEANINIGDFVYNVNIGRSAVIDYMLRANIDASKLRVYVKKVNSQFDEFCYHAVSIYTDIKSKELNEKNGIINQTHRDKLVVLGQMSASFVHEFRNPLTSIIGFNKLLRQEYPDMKYLDIIQLELDQLKFRITQFLHTSKIDMINVKEPFILYDLLDDILNFLYPSIVDTDVSLKLNIDQTIEIKANKDELKQVFLNILMNSIDAVQQREKPRIVIVEASKSENGHIVISIVNNGPIIPQEVQQTIFEPFFTTKEVGTGIGLYVCNNIIEKHNGRLTCQSTHEMTTFTIEIPINLD